MTKALKVIGGLINAVSVLSPELAGRLAFRLFSRTRSAEPATDKERALFARSATRMAEAERLEVTAGDVVSAAYRFPAIGPSNGKRVLVTHGWGSRIAYAQDLVTGLRQDGYEVYALDLPGHGLSPGRRLDAAMAVAVLSEAVRRFAPFHAMIGHSFGGYMTVIAAAGVLSGAPLNIGRLVIIAAPADVRKVLSGFSRFAGLNDRVKASLIAQIKRISGKPAEAFYGPDILAGFAGSTLVLHAEDDKEVDAEAARAYGAAGPHVTLQWLNGQGHRRILNSTDAIQAISAFLRT